MTDDITTRHMRAFYAILANTIVANVATTFLWFALTFWAYLETRSVLVTSWMGGAFMLLMAVLGVPFGTLVDRHHKQRIMTFAAALSVVAFAAAGAVYVLTPYDLLVRPQQPYFWLFIGCVLIGVLVEGIRGIALSTCVTLLVPSERRANANGLVGMGTGATILLGGTFSGLAIGSVGLGGVLAIAFVISVVTFVHLLTLRISEPVIATSDQPNGAVDFRGAWIAIVAVPGLFGLIAFTTFNNLLGGVFMGLLDPYGLELMSVEQWGVLFGVSSLGFLAGGAWVAKFGLGTKPLRSLLVALMLTLVVGCLFTIRPSIPLLIIGMVAYMCLIPVIEGAEQTVLQRVVPFRQQGRVFGLAQAIEVAASPISAFIIGPVAQFWLIPYAESPQGQAALSGLLGEGSGRGIALVFVLASVIGLVITGLAFFSRTYRVLSTTYAAGDVNATVATD